MRRILTVFFGLAMATVAFCAMADEKTEEAKEQPRVIVSAPLGLASGGTAKVTLRGIKLDATSEARSNTEGVQVKLLSKGKAELPNMLEARQVGDTQVELEIVLPETLAAGELPLVLKVGEAEAPFVLPVVGKDLLVDASGSTSGFADAQPVQAGKTIAGVIEKPKDVDVYRIELAAGKRLQAVIQAAGRGSPLDSIVTIYDARGRILASADDQTAPAPEESNDNQNEGERKRRNRNRAHRDSRLSFVAPAAGHYFLAVVDANDGGSPLHQYWLVLGSE